MPDEPTRPLERQLQAWAQERRDQIGAPFELDPIRRQELLAEVERAAAQPAESVPARVPWWRMLLPRLALAGGLAAVLLLAIAHFASRNGSDGTLELAQTDQPAAAAPTSGRTELDEMTSIDLASRAEDKAKLEAETKRRAPTASAPLSRTEPAPVVQMDKPAIAGRDDSVAQSAPVKDAAVAQEPPAAPEIAAAPRPVPSALPEAMRQRYGIAPTARDDGARKVDVGGLAESRTSSARPLAASSRESAKNALAEESVSAPTTPPQRSVTEGQLAPALAVLADRAAADSDAFADANATVYRASLSPARRYRASFGAPPAKVMQTFRFEQVGARVRIIDADGSIYAGQQSEGSVPDAYVTLNAEAPPPGSQAAQQVRAQSAPRSNANTGTFFEVSGTNQVSGEPVAFQGLVITGATVQVRGQAIVGERTRLIIDASGKALR